MDRLKAAREIATRLIASGDALAECFELILTTIEKARAEYGVLTCAELDELLLRTAETVPGKFVASVGRDMLARVEEEELKRRESRARLEALMRRFAPSGDVENPN